MLSLAASQYSKLKNNVIALSAHEVYIYIHKIMAKYQKAITFGFLLFFTPAVIAFCCCSNFDPNLSRQKVIGHHHEHSGHDHGQGHHHDKSSSASCECGHELLGNLTNKTIDITGLNLSALQFHYQSLFIEKATVSEAHKPFFHFNNTGPPGHSFSATPLYLQLSVLRI